MAQWVTPATLQITDKFQEAYIKAIHRNRINCYRSRSEVTSEMINTAFTWTYLPRIESVEADLVYPDNGKIYYVTKSIQRGVDIETAKTNATTIITNLADYGYNRVILTFNTATAAAPSEAIKQMLDTDERFTELNYRPLVTSTPNHKIHIYKMNGANTQHMYIILNNIDTPTVLFKIATALMLVENILGDATQTLAEKWLTGDADTILRTVSNYYKTYNDAARVREFDKALKAISNNANNEIKHRFERRIQEMQNTINSYYDEIRRYMQDLNRVKGEYLTQLAANEQEKLDDLKRYLTDCRDKIACIGVEGNNLILIYNTQLMYYEENLLETYFNSTRENVVNTASPAKQQLLKDIFLEHKCTMLIQSGIQINLQEKTFRFAAPAMYVPNVENIIGIPNPHHMYYNCWGDNQPIIHEALFNSNYLTAICTAFAAMSGLSLSDTAVMEKFIRDELVGWKNTPCIKINETGEIITIAEYERRFNDASNETDEQTDTGSDNGHEETAEAVQDNF